MCAGTEEGVLGDVDSLAFSEVELRDELLLESSLAGGRLVANCRMEDTRSVLSFWSSRGAAWSCRRWS